jgi:Trypsin
MPVFHTKTYTPTKDTCNGDSGGPLLDADGRQVGITSFSQGKRKVRCRLTISYPCSEKVAHKKIYQRSTLELATTYSGYETESATFRSTNQISALHVHLHRQAPSRSYRRLLRPYRYHLFSLPPHRQLSFPPGFRLNHRRYC